MKSTFERPSIENTTTRAAGPNVVPSPAQVGSRSLLAATACLTLVTFVAPWSTAAPVEAVSVRNPALALPAGGNADSAGASLSADGRYVVFSSLAGDLVPGGNGPPAMNVYLRDRTLNTLRLVSVNAGNTAGGNGHSTLGQASANGRYVVFQSDASDLVPGDTNDASDIFVRDIFTGTTRLISVATDGGLGNGASTDPVMTPDGTCVAFISAASNLVPGDTNTIPDVFVRDLITQTTWVMSVGATTNAVSGAGTMATPAITPDGRFVAFFSTAQNLVAGVSSLSRGEIYLRDRLAGRTIWASTNAAVTAAPLLQLSWMPSSHPVLSDDGRYVAFKTGWTNGAITPSGGLGIPAVVCFQYDALDGTTTIVSSNGFAPWKNCDDVYGPEMTPEGRFIAYVERESAGSTNYPAVRLWDRAAGTNVLVSADAGGSWPTNSSSHTPALSQDGRYVMFLSDATNLVSNTVSNGLHIYRRDVQTSTTVLVDVDPGGVGSEDQLGAIPSMSAGGRCAVFTALDGGLVGGDDKNALDVILWDSAAGTNDLVSARDPLVIPRTGNLVSTLGRLSLSASGDAVAFASSASDLVANDFNGEADVFVRETAGHSNILVSVGLDGNAGQGGFSHSPILSADGRYVIFVSGATNLVAGDTNGASDVFRRDLQAGATELVSVDSAGVSLGNFDSSLPVSSSDGRYVAFLCRTNALSARTNLVWRDLDSGLTRAVTTNALPNRALSMSADGQRLAYFDQRLFIYVFLNVWDANASANIYTNSTALVSAAALSPAGNQLLYQTPDGLFIDDLASGTNLFFYPTKVQIRYPVPWSADGRYVAFVTGTNLVAGDNNGTNDVYLQDLLTGGLTLVSMNQDRTGSAAGVSDWPAISADGRFVAFRSYATDVVPGIVSPPALVVYDRLTRSNNLIATATTADDWPSWVAWPSFSADGKTLTFQSWDAGLVTGDLNRAGDVLASDLNALPPWDTDGDGIPDWWTIQYFGHPTGQAGDLSRAEDDADGDGMSNLDEYLAGTSPIDPASLLVLYSTLLSGSTNVLLQWDVAPDRYYQVLSTTNLNTVVWPVVPANLVQLELPGWVVLQVTNKERYFRIQCTP